jgi:membrane-associated HD superfamily phosphohydrolase
MTNEQLLTFDRLSERVQQQQRKALFRTLLLSIATIAIAGLFLFFTYRKIDDAHQQLNVAHQQLNAVKGQIDEANAKRDQAQASLKATQDDLKAAETRAATQVQQVKSLEAQLAEAQKALADSRQELTKAKEQLDEALDLQQYIYPLKWGELKPMYTLYGQGAFALQVIYELKDIVHWDRTNDPAQSAYNSPGFAALVLRQLHRLPAGGLAALPRDMGTPNVGDIVVYEGGYHLFYFRDSSGTEFVVGMTPFGVTALHSDFGSKIMGVLRTGLLTGR